MKSKTSFAASIVGISLVLFLLGLAAGIIFKVNQLSLQYKQDLLVEIVLDDKLKSEEISSILNKIREEKFIQQVDFVSKEAAAKTLSKDLGENFLEILGYNPLYNSFNIHLKPEFTNSSNIKTIKDRLKLYNGVVQINVQENLLETLEQKITNVSLIILFFAGLLLIFSVLLIFNTIKLAMYSGRQIVHSMLLLGATRAFIMKPFLKNSILHGVSAAIIAALILLGIGIFMEIQFPEFGFSGSWLFLLFLIIFLLIFGVVISLISTWIALRKYLNFKLENF